MVYPEHSIPHINSWGILIAFACAIAFILRFNVLVYYERAF